MKHESISVIDTPRDQQLPAGEISGADSLIDMSAFERQFSVVDVDDEIARLEREVFGDERPAVLADVAIASVNEEVKPVTRTALKEETLPETEEEQEEFVQKTRTRRFGLHALKKFKNFDAKFAYVNARVISALPGTKSMEERAAHQEMLNEKFAASEDDSFVRARYKAFRRNTLKIQERASPLVLAMGAAAISRYMPAITEVVDSASTEIADFLTPNRSVTLGGNGEGDIALNGIEHSAVVHSYDSKAILIGGRGDVDGVYLYQALENQNAVSQADLVKYPAGIAPVDPVRMDVSADIAAGKAHSFYNPNDHSKQTIYGYSEGSAGAIEAYNRIVADNGGVKPENLDLVLIGAPYAGPNGFFHSNYVGTVAPVLDSMGIPTNIEVPAGATVVYSPNDFWANGNNQSFLGMMSQLADLGGAGHNPDLSGEFYEKIDENGVRHLIKKDVAHPLVELAQTHGMVLPAGASEILQQIAPINNGMSEEVPQPNAYAAVDLTAELIDRETGGSGIPQTIANNIPREWEDLGQSSLVAVNNIPNTVTAMTNGQMSPQEGMPIVMNQINDVAQDLGRVLQDPGAAIQRMVNGATNDMAAQIQAPPNLPPEAQPFADWGVQLAQGLLQTIGAPPRQ